MPTPNVIKQGQAANFVWGLPNNVNITTYGRVQSFRRGRKSEKEPLKTAEGNTDGMVFYDMNDSGSLEAIIPSADRASVEIANTVQIAGITFTIDEFEENWTSGAWAKVTLTLSHYDGIAIASGSGT
jgi:hypothetical protein